MRAVLRKHPIAISARVGRMTDADAERFRPCVSRTSRNAADPAVQRGLEGIVVARGAPGVIGSRRIPRVRTIQILPAGSWNRRTSALLSDPASRVAMRRQNGAQLNGFAPAT